MQTLSHQTGAALAVALVMLVLLTLLGVNAVSVNSVQQKISHNLIDQEYSFQAAEAALRSGEAWIMGLNNLPVPSNTCATQPCILTQDPIRQAELQNSIWWAANAAVYNDTALSNLQSQPRFIVEYSRFNAGDNTIGHGYGLGGMHYFQVTARGTGGTNNSKVILQTSVARKF